MTTKDFLALELKLAGADDAGAFTGLASAFGGVDKHGDTIAPGAYARTLAEHKAAGTMPALLWGHDLREPIGIVDELSETPTGLAIKGRLADTQRGRDARALAKMGAVTGLSIGFRTRKASTGPNGTRVLEDIDLAEISWTPSPADPRARLASVKAADAAERADSMSTTHTGAAPEIAALEAKVANLADEVKAANDRADALETQLARPAIQTKADDKTPEQKAFNSYLRKGDKRMSVEEEKALRVTNDAAGGVLAPEQFGAELIKLTREFSPIRQFARVVTIGADSVKYPRRTTSTAATWVSEVGNRTESEPAFEQITFTPHEMSTFTEVSNALLEDNGYNLEGELAADLAESFAITEGKAFVDGDGTGKPFGILAAAGIAEMVTGAAANFPTTNPADVLIRMFHAIKGVHAQNGAWAMNRNTLGVLRQFKDGQGRYLVLDGLTPGAPVTLLGRPVVEMVDMPNIAAGAFPIVFGDWSGYRVVDRVQMSILRDPYTRATNGITRFVARKRVGGDVTHTDRFIKLKVAAS